MSEQPTPTRLPVTGPPSEPIEAADLASALRSLLRSKNDPTLDESDAARSAQWTLDWWEEQQEEPLTTVMLPARLVRILAAQLPSQILTAGMSGELAVELHDAAHDAIRAGGSR
jgi:hypothetical protein